MRIQHLPVVLLLLSASACAAGARTGEATLAGSYRLTEINAQPLPAESPDEDGVMMERASLLLEPGGGYTLDVDARPASRPAAVTQVIRGTYRAAADTLTLTPTPPDASGEVRFRFQLAPGVLRLRDERGSVFTFARD